MDDLLQGFLSDPRMTVSLLGAMPGFIATILMALVGQHFWSNKLGSHYHLIALGALLVVISYFSGFFINSLMSSHLAIEQFLTILSVNNGLFGLGQLLFFLGIYRWVKTKSTTVEPEEHLRGPFIS